MARVDMMYTHALDPLKGWFQLSALDKSAPFDPSITGNGVTVNPGRVVFCNDAGNFTADRYCSNGSATATAYPGGLLSYTGTAMPMFLWAGTSDADVFNDGYNTAGTAANWIPVMPAGVSMALVATGGYELQTTEFYASPASPYTVNAPLTAVSSKHCSTNTASYGAGSTTLSGFTANYPNVGLLTTECYSATILFPGSHLIVGICSPFTQGPVNYLSPTTSWYSNTAPNSAMGNNAHGVSVISFWTVYMPVTGATPKQTSGV